MTALHTAVRAAVRAAGRAAVPAAGAAAGLAPLPDRVSATAPRLRPLPRLRSLADAGMTTAEYAVGTLAACAFAAVLIAVVRSGAIKSALSGLITTALSIAS